MTLLTIYITGNPKYYMYYLFIQLLVPINPPTPFHGIVRLTSGAGSVVHVHGTGALTDIFLPTAVQTQVTTASIVHATRGTGSYTQYTTLNITHSNAYRKCLTIFELCLHGDLYTPYGHRLFLSLGWKFMYFVFKSIAYQKDLLMYLFFWTKNSNHFSFIFLAYVHQCIFQ